MVNKTLAGIILATFVAGAAMADEPMAAPAAAPTAASDTGSNPAPKGEKGGKHHHHKGEKGDKKGHKGGKKGHKGGKKAEKGGGDMSTPAPAPSAAPTTPAQ